MDPTTDPGPTTDPDLTTLRLCAPLTDDRRINARWCKSNRVAVADVRHGEITRWQELHVGWERLHDAGPHEDHHDRMAGFLRDHAVNVIVVDHIGTCLRSTLLRMDIAVHAHASGPARQAVVTAAHAQLTR